MRESELEKKLVKEIKKMGGIAFKFVSPGNAGVPDRLCVLPGGKIVFIELKSEKGQLRPIQKIQIKKLLDLGQRVYIIKGQQELDEFIYRLRG